MRSRLLIVLWILALLRPPAARADWPSDPSVGMPVFPNIANQWSSACAPDGAGGLYVFDRPRSVNAILAQRISPTGAFVWPADAIEIGYSNPYTWELGADDGVFASTDGAGGALTFWLQGPDSLRIQRLTPGGAKLWANEGAVVSDTCRQLQTAAVTSDGQGGAIAAWCERRSLGFDYYVQRVNGSGSRSWASSGVLLGRTEAPDSNFIKYLMDDTGPELASDGLGGAFIAFTRIAPPTSQIRLFVQRVDPNGLTRWAVGGLDLFPHELTYQTTRPSMCSDGAGGLIVGAHGIDTVPGRAAIWLQRLDRDGNRLWGPAGTLIQPGIQWQLDPILRSDGVGGAFVVWSQSMDRLMVQHVSSAGGLAWPAPVIVGTNNSSNPKEAVPDGVGGLIVFSVHPTGASNLRAQRIGADGRLMWAPGGVLLRTASGRIFRRLACASDGAGGAFASWLDIDQTSYAATCEARWVSGSGWLSTVGVGGPPRMAEDGLIISPNPAAALVTIRCAIPGEGAVRLDVFDVGGRRVRNLRDGPAISGSVAATWDGLDEAGRRLPAGVYLVRVSAPAFSSTKRIVLVDH